MSAAAPAPLARSTACNLATILVSVGSGLVLSVVAARSWGRPTLGVYVYLSWLASTLGLLGSAALPALAVRLVAESLGRGEPGRARRLFARLLGLNALSVLAVALAAWLVAGAVPGLEPDGWAAAVGLLALTQSLASLAALAVQGAQRFDLVLGRTLATTFPATLLAAAIAFAGGGPRAVLLALALGHGALALTLVAAFRRSVPAGADRGGPSLAEVRPYFLFVSAVALVDLVVWQKSEVFFLGLVGDADGIALYGVAFPLAVAAVRMAPTAFAGVLTPSFARLVGRGARAELAASFRRAAWAMAALSAALGVVALGLGGSLLALYGPAFRPAYAPFALLLVGLAAANVSGVASAVFHATGRADLLLRMGVVLAAVNLALDVALIPRFGALGATLACACAQALSLPAAALQIGRGIGIRFPWPELARVAAAASAGALAVLLVEARLPAGPACDLAATAAGLAAGLTAAIALGALRPPERAVEVRDPPPVPAGEPPQATVVVPTKNRPEYVRRCVSQVLAQEGPEREVIVVDSSDDERTREVLRDFPGVRAVRVSGMPDNRHFAKNQGIRLARGDVLLFLDDDSFAEPGWLEGHLGHYADPSVGGLGGRIVDEVFARGPLGETVGGLEANGRLHLNFTRHTGAAVEVEHVIGCNMSFRRTALERVGGFDVAYGGPNFMEETDLCLRVRRAGYRILFVPDAVVFHANAPRDGGLKRQALDFRGEFWTARSRAYFALKLLARSRAVLRYNFLGLPKLHLVEAARGRSSRHLAAFFLQLAGLTLGTLDWLLAGRPRLPPRSAR